MCNTEAARGGGVKADKFKYLGSTIKTNGNCVRGEEDCTGKVGWAEMSARGDVGQKDSSKSEGYDVQDDSESETQLKMLRFSLGATRMYRIRN